jgi:hypothetical protein
MNGNGTVARCTGEILRNILPNMYDDFVKEWSNNVNRVSSRNVQVTILLVYTKLLKLILKQSNMLELFK